MTDPKSEPSEFYCNKCGYVGPHQSGHFKPHAPTPSECNYMAIPLPHGALKAARAVPADEFERGRQQGMKQERALWKLAAEGQAIEAELSGNSGTLPEPLPAGVEPHRVMLDPDSDDAHGLAAPEGWWKGHQAAMEFLAPAINELQERRLADMLATPPTLTNAQCDAIQEAVWAFEISGDRVGSDEMRALIRAAAAGDKP